MDNQETKDIELAKIKQIIQKLSKHDLSEHEVIISESDKEDMELICSLVMQLKKVSIRLMWSNIIIVTLIFIIIRMWTK